MVLLAVLVSLLQGISMRGAKILVSLSALAGGATPFQVGVLAAMFAAFPLLLAVYAGKVSDRIGVMYSGELVEVAPASSILTNPQHPYTKALGNSFPPLTGPRVRLEGIAGTPPRLTDLPPGCRFAARCPHAMDVCRTQAPELRFYPEHQSEAACHLLN